MTKKKISVIISLFFAFTVVFPMQVEARNIDSHINYITIKSMDNKMECTGDEGILGDVNDEDSVAWLLQKILNYMKILGPTITIILGSIDFTKAIITSDEESMKKSQKKFINRLLSALALFFVPLLVQIMLDLFDITSNVTCGIK